MQNADCRCAGGQRQQEKRGPSMLTTLEIDLADMYNGKHVEVRNSVEES